MSIDTKKFLMINAYTLGSGHQGQKLMQKCLLLKITQSTVYQQVKGNRDKGWHRHKLLHLEWVIFTTHTFLTAIPISFNIFQDCHLQIISSPL